VCQAYRLVFCSFLGDVHTGYAHHQYAELVHEVFRVNQQLITHVHTCEKELIG